MTEHQRKVSKPKPAPPKNAAPKAKRKPRKDLKFVRTPQLEEEICRRLSEGESLLKISKTPGFPSDSTMQSWSLDLSNPFAGNYARARELGYRRLADEILEISDNSSRDLVARETKDGTIHVVDHEHIQRARLRVDTRKWILSKMLPKVYGDRAEISGKDGGPLQIQFIKGDEDL